MLTLSAQALLTANALRNIAAAFERKLTINDLARGELAGMPKALRDHADDLEAAVRAG